MAVDQLPSILAHLSSLSPSQLDRLYISPAAALAVVRLLPVLDYNIVFRLLYSKSPMLSLPESPILADLCILSSPTSLLNPIYAQALHNSLVGAGPPTFGTPADSADKHKDVYARESWESVLHFLVGTASSEMQKPTSSVIVLLENSGLMGKQEGDLKSELVITQKGFQFLLQDVWSFLLQYIQLSSSINMDPIEVLSFLLTLGSLELGCDYSSGIVVFNADHHLDVLSDSEKIMLIEMKHLGLIYQRKSTRFYPTRLATTLTSNHEPDTSAESSEGYIILETNYRLYAYSTSPLQIAVLSLFCDLRARFPNMVVGLITRDKVREALEKGITAEQIITYLTDHSHAEMKRVLPVTVVDQFRLWEMEKHRIKVDQGMGFGFNQVAHVYDNMNAREYRETCKFAEEAGCLLYSSPERQILCVSSDGHDQIKEWLRSGRKVKSEKAARASGNSQSSEEMIDF